MNVSQAQELLDLKLLTLPSPDRNIAGGYTGDLLSWVMGRIEADYAWITIMSNINVVAVASLADVSCIILAEGVTLEKEILELASSKGINVFSSELSSYELCVKLSEALK